MARQRRFTIDNGIYHIICRGNNRLPIFHTPADYEAFLDILMNNKKKYGFKLHHFVLMPNHFHLILSIDIGHLLGRAMKRINLMYVQYYRDRYGGIGHFFQDRFKSHLIEEGLYLERCARYIELNPVRSGLAEEPEQYLWSSSNDAINRIYAGLLEHETADESSGADGTDSFIERRSEERYFRTGLWGSGEHLALLVVKYGLKPRWSHRGRPRKTC